MKVHLVTGNANKLREVNEFFKPYDIQVEGIKIDLLEIQARSIEDVARFKIQQAYEKVKERGDIEILLVEDVGLEIDGWNGLPGIYVKWFLEAVGNEGLLRMGEGSKCKAVCVYGMMDLRKNKDATLIRGEIEGTLVDKRGSKGGFGFDCIIEINGQTLGELKTDSHRIRALQQVYKSIV